MNHYKLDCKINVVATMPWCYVATAWSTVGAVGSRTGLEGNKFCLLMI